MSNEEEEPSAPTDQETRFPSLEAKLDALSSSFEALAHKFDTRSSARPTVSQNSDLEEDLRLAIIRRKRLIFPTRTFLRTVRTAALENACTKKPAKEQFSKIQVKYLRPENCEYLKVRRVNAKLWDDLLDKVKSRDVGFQAFQRGLIKGIVPIASLASKLVEAKKNKAQSIPVADAYDLAIDALTLLGNSVFEFSMKRTEMLKSEVPPGFKSLCRES